MHIASLSSSSTCGNAYVVWEKFQEAAAYRLWFVNYQDCKWAERSGNGSSRFGRNIYNSRAFRPREGHVLKDAFSSRSFEFQYMLLKGFGTGTTLFKEAISMMN